MNSTLLSIGEMAEHCHVSIPTLRLYDHKGLLKPAYTNTKTGYRYYDIKQSGRLDLIRTLQSLGMSLEEIRSVLDQHSIAQIEEILNQKKEIIDQEIRRLSLQETALQNFIDALERCRTAPPAGTLTLEYIEKRTIYAIPASIDFYAYDGIDMYERTLEELRNNLQKNGLPSLNYFRVGTTASAADFQKGVLKAKEIFAFVDSHFPAPIRTLPNGMYACIYVNGYDDEPRYAVKLRDYCRAQHYQISGDYICEIITEMNLFEEEEYQRNMFLRLQVPVIFSK
jgi:DNA-binding transcriptional MerR regulator